MAQADARTVRVGVYQNAPQVFIDDQGKPAGIYIDILNEVARREGWTIEFVPGSFADGLAAVREGRIDILTSIASTPERDGFIDFSKETIVSVWGQLYVKPSSSPQNIFDLEGQTIAVMEYGILGKKFNELCLNFGVDCRFVTVPSYDDALKAIDEGRADAAVVNSIFGASREHRYKAKRSSIMFSPFRLQVAVPEGKNRDIVQALDGHLARWRADKRSFYYQTLDHWIGLNQEPPSEVPQWVWWVMSAGSATLLVIFVWNATLRHQMEIRQKAEAALKKNEAMFRALVESTNVIAWELDLATFRFTYVSPHAEKLLGYPIEQWKEDGFWASHIAPDDRDWVLSLCKSETQVGRDHDFEYRMIKADGTPIWLRDIVTVQKDAAGKAVSLSGFMVDIDDRKAFERQLKDARYQAEKANQAKSEFLASMSHDLRTPLNAIMGFSDMMRQEAFGPIGNRRYSEYAKDINESGALLVSLIDDVLDLSKIEAGKYELVETPIEVNEMVRSSVNMVSTLTAIKGIAVTMDLPEPSLVLSADRRSLTQILNNLLSNAVKFTPDKGKIWVRTAVNENGGIEISVKDSGIGMTRRDIERVLNPFEQADSAHSKRHEGTGLGLHICQKFLALHGGEIRIESDPGTGTCMTAVFSAERTLEQESRQMTA